MTARQAVLLAAGTGSRLRPLTDTQPKCLIPLGGRPMLEMLLAHLAQAGIERAVIVTGYLSAAIEQHLRDHPPPLQTQVVRNPDYETSNNAVSLVTARPLLAEDDFILCDADVVLRGPGLMTLCGTPGCALLVEERTDMGDEEMKVLLTDGRVTRLSKELPPSDCFGESIGIQKVGAAAGPTLWRTLDDMLQRGRRGAYYEEAFQHMIDGGENFAMVPVAGADWIEVDDLADLEEARRRYG